MNDKQPKILIEEHEKFMKKRDAQPFREYSCYFYYKTFSSMNKAAKRIIKQVGWDDIRTFSKGTESRYDRSSKRFVKSHFTIRATLLVRNAHRINLAATVDGVIFGTTGLTQEKYKANKISMKTIEKSVKLGLEQRKIITAMLYAFSNYELKVLKTNLVLRDKLIRSIYKRNKFGGVYHIDDEILEIAKKLRLK